MNNETQFNLYEQKKSRKKYVIFAVVIILFLGIGYAYLQTILTISGTTTVKDNDWLVYWNNIQVNPDSVSATASPNVGATYSSTPTTLSDQTSITFNVTLDKPGDFYEFTVDAVNGGTLDAMIADNGIVKTIMDNSNNQVVTPSYFQYEVTYGDYFPVQDRQKLGAGETQSYRVRVGYKDDINEADLQDEAKSFTVTFEVNYVQAKPNMAIDVPSSTYSVSPETFTIGQAVPNTATTQNTFQAASAAAMTAFGHPLFIRYGMKDGVVDSAYIVFKKDGKFYYINTSRSNYSEVVTQLTSLFSNGCSPQPPDSGSQITSYSCTEDDFTVQMWYDSQGFAVNIVYDLDSSNSGLSGSSCISCDLGSGNSHFSGCIDLSQTQTVMEFSSSCYLMQ